MSHLQEYLQHYSTLKAPGYAVLVTGEWGTGKTFQVKECLPDESYIYVSLYGLQTVEQIHAEVFAAAHPAKAKTSGYLNLFKGKDVGALGFTVPLGVVPEVANAFLKNEVKPGKTLVFDDLERSSIDLGEVLGAINSYVEHKEFRVIVIAHDDENLLGEKFKSIKEKTFGQTIRIEPQVEMAFECFSSEVKDDEGKGFVKSHKPLIVDVFQRSQEKSLRVLRHVIEDLVRLHKSLHGRHRECEEAMTELVMSFTAFAVGFRSGDLEEKDLRNRRGVRVGYMMRVHGNAQNAPKTPPLVVANEKYPEIDLETGMLNDAVLVSMLVEGRFPTEEIRKSIDNSPHFIIPEDVSPWKVVIQFDKLDDGCVEIAQKRMEEQLEKREITGSGEMLHVFSLRMMMAENGIIDQSVEAVVNEGKDYISQLLKDGRLPPRGTDWRWYDDFERAYDGFCYWVSAENFTHFKEILDHLITSRELALQATFPDVLKDLLQMVSEDPNAFSDAVSSINNGPSPYAYIPLLHGIEPKEFVDAWLSADRNNWRYVNLALENRYGSNQLERDLSPEKEWALKILSELDRRSETETGFRALRIKRIRPNVLLQLAQEPAPPEVEVVAETA